MAPTSPIESDYRAVADDLSTNASSNTPSPTSSKKRVRSEAEEPCHGSVLPPSKKMRVSKDVSGSAIVSSQPLGYTNKTVFSNHITKMGRYRPWVFEYESAAGLGLYAFMKCPATGCKHKFSGHPLEQGRAVEHFKGCQVQIENEKDMVKQYASQVVKDPNRKSDLTLEWAAMSNASARRPKPSPAEQEPIPPRRSSRKRAAPARYGFANTTDCVGNDQKMAAGGSQASEKGRIVVNNLPLDVGEGQLDAYFRSAVGGVVRLEILREAGVSLGVARVVFDRPDIAKKARRKLNGLLIDGKPIEVAVVENFEA